jgi:hypothetical protein
MDEEDLPGADELGWKVVESREETRCGDAGAGKTVQASLGRECAQASLRGRDELDDALVVSVCELGRGVELQGRLKRDDGGADSVPIEEGDPLLEPVGAELFVRVRTSGATQVEIGPSLLRYRWADDCGECTGTFAGVHAAAMVGTGSFWLGPTARYGVVSGGPAGSESGFMWGIQGRLQFSWGD